MGEEEEKLKFAERKNEFCDHKGKSSQVLKNQDLRGFLVMIGTICVQNIIFVILEHRNILTNVFL